MAALRQAREVFRLAVGANAPAQRLVLRVTLAEEKGNLRFHQLLCQIEGMRRIVLDPELRIERQRIGGNMMARGIVDMDSILGDLDPIVAVADLAGDLGDLVGVTAKGDSSWTCRSCPPYPLGRLWSRLAAYINRRAASCSCRVRRVWGLTCTTSTLPISSSEQMPSSSAVMPDVGLGELGQVAGAHQHRRVRTRPPPGHSA